MKRFRLSVLLSLLLPLAALAEPALWVVQGKHNTLYLTGTVHVLPTDTALPGNIAQAYEKATQLVLEIDLSSAASLTAAMGGMQAGLLPQGQTLDQLLDATTRRRLNEAASRLGISSELLAPFAPWLAALTLEQLQLAQMGMDSSSGIDMQLTARASQDGKRIRGLETIDDQLQIFSRMNAKQQLDYLRYTLDELDTLPKELDRLLVAWQGGDEQHLRQLLSDGLDQNRELYAALTTTRNRRWLQQIKPLLDQERGDVLVAVGALHLVGDEGLVTLLQRAGYRVTRR